MSNYDQIHDFSFDICIDIAYESYELGDIYGVSYNETLKMWVGGYREQDNGLYRYPLFLDQVTKEVLPLDDISEK